jgi:predicted DNA-binding WGR domain protein
MYDFRDQEPMWFRYAEYVGDGSNKYWEARIDLADDGQFILTTRWGAKPDRGAGQIKTAPFARLPHAQNSALNQFGAKIKKGYAEVDRPHAANNKVFREVGHDYYADDEAF